MSLTASLPPHLPPTDQVPSVNNPPYQGDQAQFLFTPEWMVSVPCKLAGLLKQDSNILPQEPWASQPPGTLTPASHHPWLFAVSLSATPTWPSVRVVSPFPQAVIICD